MNPITRRRLLISLPLLGGIGLGSSLYYILYQIGKNQFNPHEIDRSITTIPNFNVEPILSFPTFKHKDLLNHSQPVLINFFSSWCAPCYIEMKFLKILSKYIAIWGIAYKDDPSKVEKFIDKMGNPYQSLAIDKQGDAGIEWGVIGVPESFLILPHGKIAWRCAQPIDQTLMRNLITLLKTDHVTTNKVD